MLGVQLALVLLWVAAGRLLDRGGRQAVEVPLSSEPGVGKLLPSKGLGALTEPILRVIFKGFVRVLSHKRGRDLGDDLLILGTARELD